MKEKLIAIAQEQALADFNQIKGDVVEATFGQQIRNYVFAPYKMVKDTRTGYETSQVSSEILDFISFLSYFIDCGRYKMSWMAIWMASSTHICVLLWKDGDAPLHQATWMIRN